MDRPTVQGSVSPRGGKWLAQLPPSLGRKSKIKTTEAEAWAWIVAETAKATLGVPVDGGSPTLAELVTVWLGTSLLKPTTRVDYRIRIDSHIVSHPAGALPMRDLLPRHIDEILLATPHNWTRLHVSKILSSFCGWAEDNEYTAGNPYRRSQAKRIGQVAYRVVERNEATENVWTPDQLVEFIEHEPDPIYRDYWIFVAATGARRGESIGVTWPNVFPDEGWCWLERNITTAGNEIFDTDSPKTWKRRKAYFDPGTVGRLLNARKAEQAAHRETCETWAGEWVFDRRRGWGKRFTPGTHLAPATVTQRFNRHTNELQLPPLAGPHGLRRTFATLAEREGLLQSVRDAALGHTPDVRGRYTKPSNAELHELAERLAKVMFGGLRTA